MTERCEKISFLYWLAQYREEEKSICKIPRPLYTALQCTCSVSRYLPDTNGKTWKQFDVGFARHRNEHFYVCTSWTVSLF